MLPSRVGSPSHGRMTKLHIHRGTCPPPPTTTATHPNTCLHPPTLLWGTLNDEVRNFEVESKKNTHI